MVSPRRKRAAVAQQAQAKYDAGGFGRRVRSWSPPSTGPQRAIEGTTRVRDRSRDATRNDWAGASLIQKWATHLVGVAITPRWKNKRFTKLWNAHVAQADADGVSDAYGMQTLGVRAWFEGGEVFLRRRPRDLSLPLAAPVQYQLIESDYLPMFDATTWPGMPVGNDIRQGIERNRFGRRVAYWMYREHPGDKTNTPNADMLLRIPASEVSHVFEPKRPGQLRGVSELASVLVRLRSTGDYEDAVLERQKLSNLFVAFITRTMPDLEDVEFDPLTGLPKFYDTNGTPMAGLEPGTTQELMPGEGVEFATPPGPGTTYSEYLRSAQLGTAAGGGMPYELMSGDIKDISDRALRVIINDFHRLAQQRQWQTAIPRLCQPMVDWWADALVLKGDISLDDLGEAKACKWSPHGWEYMHPVQDAEGKIALIDAGLLSRSRVAGERGDDVEEIDDEREEDQRRAAQKNLVPVVKPPVVKPPIDE
jgi:lambda family phage portal protein